MKTDQIISAISGSIFLALLCLPFYFLSFWWAVLVAYTIFAMLIALFVYGAAKASKEYDEMIERQMNDKVF